MEVQLDLVATSEPGLESLEPAQGEQVRAQEVARVQALGAHPYSPKTARPSASGT
jgi:hypothetical protein